MMNIRQAEDQLDENERGKEKERNNEEKDGGTNMFRLFILADVAEIQILHGNEQ
jgi:hypothetical protein